MTLLRISPCRWSDHFSQRLSAFWTKDDSKSQQHHEHDQAEEEEELRHDDRNARLPHPSEEQCQEPKDAARSDQAHSQRSLRVRSSVWRMRSHVFHFSSSAYPICT